jgi:hypothetical protein
MALSGCGQPAVTEHPFPPQLPNTHYRVTVHQEYAAEEPVALMTFRRDARGNPVAGAIVGKIHGWPFPYADLSGDTGEGLFTYRTDFTVTHIGKDGMPAAGRGVRTVYFHPDRRPISLEQLNAFATGKPIVRDSSSLFFDFKNKDTVDIAITAHQISAAPFAWNGVMITPPTEPPSTQDVTASYASQYRGYVFSPSS